MERARHKRFQQTITVRCLCCNEPYVKPLGGGTVRANPGCPRCGYVGWVLAPEAPSEAASPRRSAEDRPRRRSA
jgi:hypothetical protein